MHNSSRVWQGKDKKQKTYLLAGGFTMILAMIGVVFPVIPQVPFAIIAAYFFSKASPRMHRWVRGNRFFGQAVRDWEDHRVVNPKLKALSIVMMFAGAGIAHWKLPLPWAIGVDVAFLLAILFLVTRKSRPQ